MSPDWSKMQVPLLSAANWGGQGSIRGAISRASPRSLLAEVAGGARNRALDALLYRLRPQVQKRFFDYFLKGEDNGWDKEPRGPLQVRHIERFEQRSEQEWPLARTQWTKFYLDLMTDALLLGSPTRKARVPFMRVGMG